MATNEQKLHSDYQDVVQTIRRYRNIVLVGTAGEPVDEYDIEYRVKGYTLDANGKVVIAKRHRVKITIPFGFPHFPPTIKPLSLIFHPEIDDYVVPIANYWENNKSLSQLIIHLGEMICAVSYNTESSFNRKAAEYYERSNANLPLDSLELESKARKKEKEPFQLDFLAPVFKVGSVVFLLVLLGVGGLFAYEKIQLHRTEKLFSRAESFLSEQEFQKARSAARQAQDQLGAFYLLRTSRTALEDDIATLLQSERLRMGLQGKLHYKGQYVERKVLSRLNYYDDMIEEARRLAEAGKLDQAVATFAKAFEYADTHELDVDIREPRQHWARLRLELLVSASEKAHAEKDRRRAIENHEMALKFIDENGALLEKGAEKAEKINHMLLIDKIALFSREASEAEERNDYATALQRHREIIALIRQFQAEKRTAMKNTLENSIEKTNELQELLFIKQKRQWLLNNFRDIFQAHYPNILPSTLRNPQAIFLKYDDSNLVFDLSCLEKGVGTVVRLRLYYQFNMETGEWSVYSGTI